MEEQINKFKDFLYEVAKGTNPDLAFRRISTEEYNSILEKPTVSKQVKGNSNFDKTRIIRDYLVDGQEFILDYKYDFDDPFEYWEIKVIIELDNIYYMLIDSGNSYHE